LTLSNRTSIVSTIRPIEEFEMPVVEIDERTAMAVNLAAEMAGVTPGEVIRRLVERSRPAAAGAQGPEVASHAGVAVHAVYDGHRTAAVYDQATHRVTITDGPLAGTSYKSPSGAAIAVVTNSRPDVNPNRNGWSFWTVTATGRLLQTLRDN